MADEFSLTVSMSETKVQELNEQGYTLCIAKMVENQYNVIFSLVGSDSGGLNPHNTFIYKNTYEMYATRQEFTPGGEIQQSGDPKAMNLGDLMVLAEGVEQVVPGGGTTAALDFLNKDVGHNVVILALNVDPNTGKEAMQPIFISPHEVLQNMTGNFQPQDNVQIWFAQDINTPVMIGYVSSMVATSTLKAGHTNQVTYNDDGTWSGDINPSDGLGGRRPHHKSK